MSRQQIVAGIFIVLAFIGAIVGIVSAIMKKSGYEDYQQEGFTANNTTAYILMGIGFPVAIIAFFFMIDDSLSSMPHIAAIVTTLIGTVVGLIGTLNIH